MSPPTTPPLVANQTLAAAVGAALVLAGAWLLHQAYDARGESRPFVLKLLPS